MRALTETSAFAASIFFSYSHCQKNIKRYRTFYVSFIHFTLDSEEEEERSTGSFFDDLFGVIIIFNYVHHYYFTIMVFLIEKCYLCVV